MSKDLISQIKETIRDVPDFPKPGIIFKDITPILLKPKLVEAIVNEMAESFKGSQVDAVAGIEARGYLFGVMFAQKLNVPFIMIRKSGKLPAKTIQKSYALEYGEATIEMHEDAIKKGMNVLIHDDLLATGGTAKAVAEMLQLLDVNVAGFSFLIDLTFLKGVEVLKTFSKNIHSIIKY